MDEGVLGVRNGHVGVVSKLLVQSVEAVGNFPQADCPGGDHPIGHPRVVLQDLEGDPARLNVELLADLSQARLPLGKERLYWLGIGNPYRRGGRPARRAGDCALDVLNAVASDGGGRHDRTAEALGELIRIYMQTALLREIHHVENHDHRNVHLDQLQGKVEIALEVRGIHNVDHDIRLSAQEVVPGNYLVLSGGGEGVDPRKVHDVDASARELGGGFMCFGRMPLLRGEGSHKKIRGRVVGEKALLLLDGHTGPVANPLTRAGEAVEDRCLA